MATTTHHETRFGDERPSAQKLNFTAGHKGLGPKQDGGKRSRNTSVPTTQRGTKGPRVSDRHAIAVRQPSPAWAPSHARAADPADMDEREIAGALRHILHRLGRDEARTDHPFVELVDAFEARRVVPGRLKARSIKWYRRACNVLREECGDLPLESTDWQAVAASILAERRQAAWQILQILRAILVFGQRIGWRTSPHDLGPVLKRCRYQPRDVVYTAAEVARLLRTLDDLDRTHPLQFPSRDVIRVLLFTGCRLMEIASLRREEWLGDRLRLRDSKTGPRTVPLCGEAQIVLGRQRVRDGWMFPGRTSHVSGRRVEDVYREAVQAAGLLGTPHALRHTFITLAVDNGVPAEVLKSIVGHTSTSYITANYYHPSKRTEQTACAVVANAIANAKGGRS